MHFFSVAAFLLMSALGLPTKAGKCPRVCSCDSAKLTVTCVGKNLTEVPPTIDEVRNSNMYIFVQLFEEHRMGAVYYLVQFR